MHHSDQLYLFRSTRLLYPSPLIVFSKCQEQTNRRRRRTSHLVTMRPNAKHGENAMHGYNVFSWTKSPSPEVSLGAFLFDIGLHFLPRRPPWWSSNYTRSSEWKVKPRQSTTPSQHEISHYAVILLWIKTTGRVKHCHQFGWLWQYGMRATSLMNDNTYNTCY